VNIRAKYLDAHKSLWQQYLRDIIAESEISARTDARRGKRSELGKIFYVYSWRERCHSGPLMDSSDVLNVSFVTVPLYIPIAAGVLYKKINNTCTFLSLP
jgi:hypothetical protein